MKQSIFDNDTFFAHYQALRTEKGNYNECLEQPAMRKLLPEIVGKRILDLGCGCGHNCEEFAARHAACVVGVDLSEKMLAVAKQAQTQDPRFCKTITYHAMDMTEIASLGQTFDLLYSSLAFHYVENFPAFAKTLFACTAPGGYLLFSQEHPLTTATIGGKQHYNYDEMGNPVSFTFSDYGASGKRSTFWFVDGVEKYHRTFSEIITALAQAGYHIEQVVEPKPEAEALRLNPKLGKERIRPMFLIVKARKLQWNVRKP